MNKMNLSDKVFYLRMESKSEDDIRNYIKGSGAEVRG